jgi:hypothetical protein
VARALAFRLHRVRERHRPRGRPSAMSERGPRGGEVTDNVTIQSVTINSIASGTFLDAEGNVDEPSVLGGGKLLVDPKLN